MEYGGKKYRLLCEYFNGHEPYMYSTTLSRVPKGGPSYCGEVWIPDGWGHPEVDRIFVSKICPDFHRPIKG